MTGEQPSAQPSVSGVSLERRIAELTILYEVSRTLQTTLDEERALYTILVGVTAGRGLGFNRAFILLVDSDQKYLEGRIAIGPASAEEAAATWRELRGKHQTLGGLLKSVQEKRIKRDLRVNEIVAQIRIPLSNPSNALLAVMTSREASLCINGIFAPGGLQADPHLIHLLGRGDFAAAPLFLADNNLGVLLADNAITGRPIEVNDLRLLQIYAQAAGAAIQNTRLYRELEAKISLWESTNQALRDNQQHLLQAERLSTIGKMAALLAHEIRTPLVSIGGFARRLLRSSPAGDPRKEELDIIVSEVARLERLVGEVLGYCKISKPDYVEVDINALIQSVLLTLRSEIGRNLVQAALTLTPDLPHVQADDSQLRQAMINLVMNALDAMPSGGTLAITTSLEAGFIEIGVSDTGVGIAREHWGKLFNPFFTTKSTGTGLGLAIVSQVLDNHRGSLRFESIPGQGTIFQIRLAVLPSPESASDVSSGVACAVEANP